MSRSNHMLTVLAPPAIKYPARATHPIKLQLGTPWSVMNIGAIVVTSSNEMILGFVRATRSATSDTAAVGERVKLKSWGYRRFWWRNILRLGTRHSALGGRYHD